MPFVLRPWPPSPTFLVCSPARNTCTPRALSTPYLASQQGVRFPTDLRSGISHACTKQTSPLIRPFVKDTFRQKCTLHVCCFARLARLTMREMLLRFSHPTWLGNARGSRFSQAPVFTTAIGVRKRLYLATTSNLLCATKRARVARVLPAFAVGRQRSAHVAGWHLRSTAHFGAVVHGIPSRRGSTGRAPPCKTSTKRCP